MDLDEEKKQKLQRIIDVIFEHDLVFFGDIEGYIPECTKTLYNWGFQDLQVIKDALNKNKIIKKVGLREKWYNSDNATVQISLYKLIAEDHERQKLSQSYVDVTTKGEQLNKIDLSGLSDEALQELEDNYKENDGKKS